MKMIYLHILRRIQMHTYLKWLKILIVGQLVWDRLKRLNITRKKDKTL